MNCKWFWQIMIVSTFVATFSSAAADTGWTNIAISEKDNSQYDIKNGSFEVTKTKGNVPIAVVIGRVQSKSSISVFKWYVPLQACLDKLGTVVSLNLSGDYQFENDFVVGGGNIAASMGETICAIAEKYFTEINQKSL